MFSTSRDMLGVSDFVDRLNLIGESVHVSCPCLLSDSGRQFLDELLGELKQRDSVFVRRVFKDWLSTSGSNQVVPPLELIWKLNEEEFLYVTTYFYVKKKYAEELLDSFSFVCRRPRTGDDATLEQAVAVVSNIVVVIVNTLKHHKEELRLFVRDICERICGIATRLMFSGSAINCYLTDLRNSIFLFEACFIEFVIIGFRRFLRGVNDKDESHRFDFVVQNHAKLWSIEFLNLYVRQYLEKVISILTIEVLLEEFQTCAEIQPTNFDGLMQFLSVLSVDKAESMSSIKDCVNRWLTSGDPIMLRVALLVARHCCHQKAKFFNSYLSWLDTLPWKSTEFVSSFYKLLTELVPYEPPLYLKIHVTKIPSTNRHVVDYVNLAKTRLSDMNESTSFKGFFGDLYDTDTERQNSDVTKVIAHFVEKKEIAQPVLEAAAICKQYYETVFLKLLLQVPEKEDSDRARLVRMLYSRGKIPQGMYLAWKNL